VQEALQVNKETNTTFWHDDTKKKDQQQNSIQDFRRV